ncbi:MAG: thioesterase [Acidimicrobiia bacterium]|nr:thioesterase [Acidimicrobiia bacterium]
MTLRPGLTATVSLVIGSADLAPALGSGDVPVLATPRLLALCEAATVAAVAPHLAPGETTVGARVELDHLAPSPRGSIVAAAAVLEEVDGRRLTFGVTAHQDGREVARGRVIRVMVDRTRFPTA